MVTVNKDALAAIEQFLDRRPYPIEKYTLIASAAQDHTDRIVWETMSRLPDRRYHSKADVLSEMCVP
jgi:Protein of unknown function (DUF2795)